MFIVREHAMPTVRRAYVYVQGDALAEPAAGLLARIEEADPVRR
ncbi:hypothetical protein [Streptomyces cavernae]|nr:hypothetical protein [Streptomyces cavernae]